MKTIYVLFIVLAAVVFSCRSKADEAQLAKVTELENIIVNIEDNLSIDEEEISARLDSIKLILNYLSTQKHDSGDVETHGALTRYFGIQKNYEAYTNLYPSFIYDLEKYRAKVADLRQRTEKGEIAGNAFENQYRQNKTALQQLDKQAAALSYNTFAVEGDYRRSHEKVKNLYMRVKSRR